MEVVKQEEEKQEETQDVTQEMPDVPEVNKVSPEAIIDKLEKGDYTIYFYCPPMSIPSGGISVLFKYAKTLKEQGFNATIIYEPREDKMASLKASQKKNKQITIHEPFSVDWLGSEAEGVDIRCLGDGEIEFNNGEKHTYEPLNLNPEDFLIIPEGFPNVMESTLQLPCKRIVMAQSWYYVLNMMPPSQVWQNYGIRDVISVSDGITEYLNAVMPGLSIKNCSPSINNELFKKPEKISDKKPMVVYMGGRSQEAQLKTINVIKTFYAFYPQFRWVRFHELRGLSKEEFAEQLSTAAVALYTDEIAGFGTFPLEAMACGTHVVGWTPLGGKEYMNDKNGFWTTNGDIFKLAELLGFALEKYFTSQLDSDVVSSEYEKTLERYAPEKEVENITNIFNQYKDERIEEISNLKQ